jgi:hypothetical protein
VRQKKCYQQEKLMADAHDDAAGKNQSALDLNRRKFLKRVGYVGAGVALSDLILQNTDKPVEATLLNTSPTSETMQLQAETDTLAATSPDEIPRRKLGRTGVEVSAIGLGGADWVRHLAWMKPYASPMKRLMLG